MWIWELENCRHNFSSWKKTGRLIFWPYMQGEDEVGVLVHNSTFMTAKKRTRTLVQWIDGAPSHTLAASRFIGKYILRIYLEYPRSNRYIKVARLFCGPFYATNPSLLFWLILLHFFFFFRFLPGIFRLSLFPLFLLFPPPFSVIINTWLSKKNLGGVVGKYQPS